MHQFARIRVGGREAGKRYFPRRRDTIGPRYSRTTFTVDVQRNDALFKHAHCGTGRLVRAFLYIDSGEFVALKAALNCVFQFEVE